MQITIRVTQRDIARGKKLLPDCCPIARAAKRVPGASLTCIRVSHKSVRLHGKRIPLPAEAMAFIAAFDDGLPVRPFSFTVEA